MGVDYEIKDVNVENMAGDNVPVTITVKLLKNDYFLASNRYQTTMTINKVAYTCIKESTVRFKSAEGSYTQIELPRFLNRRNYSEEGGHSVLLSDSFRDRRLRRDLKVTADRYHGWRNSR